MLSKIAPYRKAIIALVIGVLTVLSDALTDGAVTDSEWKLVGLAVLSGLAVFLTPNTPAA